MKGRVSEFHWQIPISFFVKFDMIIKYEYFETEIDLVLFIIIYENGEQ